ncbi:hypothetical protein CHELA1G11_11540 [Hyphomicrobiales bacterium]|nr:hypothetical protein CHELA1G11_11540 [Hyphomicrobiales bacterium]CAH1667048.1 hypothetical protein CHELA1G2_12769 [Hyphomicrobiales bacterium]
MSVRCVVGVEWHARTRALQEFPHRILGNPLDCGEKCHPRPRCRGDLYMGLLCPYPVRAEGSLMRIGGSASRLCLRSSNKYYLLPLIFMGDDDYARIRSSGGYVVGTQELIRVTAPRRDFCKKACRESVRHLREERASGRSSKSSIVLRWIAAFVTPEDEAFDPFTSPALPLARRPEGRTASSASVGAIAAILCDQTCPSCFSEGFPFEPMAGRVVLIESRFSCLYPCRCVGVHSGNFSLMRSS